MKKTPQIYCLSLFSTLTTEEDCCLDDVLLEDNGAFEGVNQQEASCFRFASLSPRSTPFLPPFSSSSCHLLLLSSCRPLSLLLPLCCGRDVAGAFNVFPKTLRQWIKNEGLFYNIKHMWFSLSI